MIASVQDVLVFIDQRVYGSENREPYKLDVSTLSKAEMNCFVAAAKRGFITITRSVNSETPRFDVSLTPDGVIEVLFIPRAAA